MSDIAVRIENLGKCYRLGHTVDLRRTFRETLAELPKRLIGGGKGRIPAIGTNENVDPQKETDHFWALRDINIELKKGEVLGIIGRNGAGKSTLLKILSRITDPTTGRAVIRGRMASLLEVGTGFHAELTGRENIYLNGKILGMKRAEIDGKFDEIVAFAEVEKFLDTPVKRYSSGMYVRLAFAVAAHMEPEIMIVDEVLAVGDLAFQKKCLGKMEKEAVEGRTILFVSHNMDAVSKLCTRGVFLQDGKVAIDDSVEKAVQHYVATAAEAQTTYKVKPPDNASETPGYACQLTIEDARTAKPSKSIPVGVPWQVRVNFRINRTLEHFIVALGMSTAMGTPLRTGWSKPRKITPGDYTAVFKETQVMLSAGQYALTLGLSEYENSFHFAENAGTLTIAEYSEGIELTRIQHAGILLNPFDIELYSS